MKRRGWFFIFFLANIISAVAQITITGKVVDEMDQPLEGASVYLNNTSIGTTTNDLGEFELQVREGVYDLIVSYIGYQTLQYQLDTNKPNKPFVFKTLPVTNMLDEIVLTNKKYSAKERAYFLSRFKKTFLGETELSEECKITNLDVIKFRFDASTNVLEAYTTEPIIIINKGLGYKISYNLVKYELTPTKIIYLGYSKYDDLKGSKRKIRRWKKNRLRAYHGSKMHFIRSVINGNFSEEGFVVDEYQRIPNPERPTDSMIAAARKYLRSTSNTLFSTGSFPVQIRENLQANIKGKKSSDELVKAAKKALKDMKKGESSTQNSTSSIDQKRDAALAVLRKARLKKTIDKKLREQLTEKDFITRNGEVVTMKYDHLLYIKYMKEKEEDNFRPGPRRLDHQITKLVLLSDSVILDKMGIFIEPLDIFTEGYWGYEKTADALPLDYDPEK